MKITDVRCATIKQYPVIRVVTDEGIDGFSQVEFYKPYVKAQLPLYRSILLGQKPTEVERTVRSIRKLGGFKPWGSLVSAIEVALWDIAGKAAGLPIHRLLGGKLRDRVRVYNTGGVGYASPTELRQGSEGFTIAKYATAYHGGEFEKLSGHTIGDWDGGPGRGINRGPLTERGLQHQIEKVYALKEQLGDGIGLAMDCGPGWTLADAIRFAKALEPLNLMWLEDLITGDYSPYTSPGLYRDLTTSTTTPIHTGEQIYLRQNFMDLIEHRAVDVIGPDPLDVGGLAELKWIAEYADLHSISIAPHGIGDGIFGLAALIQVSSTLPQNFIAFECPRIDPPWYDIVQGLPSPVIQDGFVTVGDQPGLGVVFKVEAAKSYLSSDDLDFFD